MAERTTTLAEFYAEYPKVRDAIIHRAALYHLPETQKAWFKLNLERNPVGGKCNRGMAVPDSVSILLGRALDEKEYSKASTLGWMIELLQATFLVSDDIMDGNMTRRGRNCWHREEGVGLNAINDAFMLEAAIYVLLKESFRSHPSYVATMELFHETSFQTEMGQLCDLITPSGKSEMNVQLDTFTPERYSFIAIHKTAYYSFYLPIALSLHLLSRATPSNLKTAKEITLLLGEYFQIQDDFLDCYGALDQIGKDGSDIRDGKCSWLIVQALQRASPEQRRSLQMNYGQAEGQEQVKKIYDQLALKEVYHALEEATANEIRVKISHIDEGDGLRREVFVALLEKIYQRTK